MVINHQNDEYEYQIRCGSQGQIASEGVCDGQQDPDSFPVFKKLIHFMASTPQSEFQV